MKGPQSSLNRTPSDSSRGDLEGAPRQSAPEQLLVAAKGRRVGLSNRCVVVLGTGRSGTSTVAGILHTLGVSMGHELLGPHWSNPRGHFEDRSLVELNERAIGSYFAPRVQLSDQALTAGFARLVAKRASDPVWGLKDPRLCITGRWLLQLLPNARVVVASRDPEASSRSLAAVHPHEIDLERSRQLIGLYQVQLEQTLREFGGAVLRVCYEALLDRPREHVDLLAKFAFEGAENHSYASESARELAVRFVDPSLCRHGSGSRRRPVLRRVLEEGIR